MHGDGVLLTRGLKKGELAGLHWYHYTPPQRMVPLTDKMMFFYPPECNVIEVPDQRGIPCELPGRPSTNPTKCMPPKMMVGCFPRAVNHHCEGSTELHFQEVNIHKRCATVAPSEGPRDLDCAPQEVINLPRKPGTKVYGAYLRALRDLNEGDEVTYNYQTAPDYIWKEPHVVAGCDAEHPATRAKREDAARLT